jgi:hypothetical protein
MVAVHHLRAGLTREETAIGSMGPMRLIESATFSTSSFAGWSATFCRKGTSQKSCIVYGDGHGVIIDCLSGYWQV